VALLREGRSGESVDATTGVRSQRLLGVGRGSVSLCCTEGGTVEGKVEERGQRCTFLNRAAQQLQRDLANPGSAQRIGYFPRVGL